MRVNTSGVECEQLFLKVLRRSRTAPRPPYEQGLHQLHDDGKHTESVGRSPCHRVGEAAYERHKQNSIGQPAAKEVIPLNSGFHRSSDLTHNTREQDPWKGRARRIGTHHG